MPLLPILTIIFVIAKLAGFIAWSWWLVLAPSLVGAALGLLLLTGALAAYVFGKQ